MRYRATLLDTFSIHRRPRIPENIAELERRVGFENSVEYKNVRHRDRRALPRLHAEIARLFAAPYSKRILNQRGGGLMARFALSILSSP